MKSVDGGSRDLGEVSGWRQQGPWRSRWVAAFLDEVTGWRLSWLSERTVGRRRVRGLGGGAGGGGHVEYSEVRRRPVQRGSL